MIGFIVFFIQNLEHQNYEMWENFRAILDWLGQKSFKNCEWDFKVSRVGFGGFPWLRAKNLHLLNGYFASVSFGGRVCFCSLFLEIMKIMSFPLDRRNIKLLMSKNWKQLIFLFRRIFLDFSIKIKLLFLAFLK